MRNVRLAITCVLLSACVSGGDAALRTGSGGGDDPTALDPAGDTVEVPTGEEVMEPVIPLDAAPRLCRASVLTAQRRYSPNLWLDARLTLSVALHFRIPTELPVSVGNSGNHTALFKFGPAATGPLVTCTYRGVGARAAPTDPAEIAAANRYAFESCDNGAAAGTEITAPYLSVRVSSGGDYIVPGGRTEVTLELREAGVCCDGGDLPANPVETCDSIDNDCDAIADEDAGGPWMVDADRDGAGDPATALASCTPIANRVLTGGDCDDRNPAIHPGATETCDNLDQDCDLKVDEGAGKPWFLDDDADGFGAGGPVLACLAPPRRVDNARDCNDRNDTIHPGAPELCDGLDNDCAGGADNGWFLDDDADGFGDPGRPANGACVVGRFINNNRDCNDRNDQVSPSGVEICNGVDDNCNTLIDDDVINAPQFYRDADGDGFGDPNQPANACGAPPGFVANDADCDDADAQTHPGAPEVPDGRDNDCDLVIDEP